MYKRQEEYSLKINRDGVFLKGGSERALHYADITYKQILREDGNMLRECEIRDVYKRQGYVRSSLLSGVKLRRSRPMVIEASGRTWRCKLSAAS